MTKPPISVPTESRPTERAMCECGKELEPCAHAKEHAGVRCNGWVHRLGGHYCVGERGNMSDNLATPKADPPKCPKCGEPATFRDVMGELWDRNAHDCVRGVVPNVGIGRLSRERYEGC